MKTAKVVQAVVVLAAARVGNTEVIEVGCADFDAYKVLPQAVELDGRVYGLTGWSSDTGRACYRTDARVAKVVLTPEDITIKVTETDLRNVSYIKRREGRWFCVLSSGTLASYHFAGVSGDEMGFQLKLERCQTAKQALVIVRQTISKRYVAEVA